MKRLVPSHFSRRPVRFTFLLGIIGLLAIVHSHYQLAMVFGNSMRPGFQTGDLLLVSKTAYTTADPDRGDIVVARYANDLIVKRVVGLPGEEVALQHGHLYIDGYAVPERHAIEPGSLDISPGILFTGKYALLGDNRSMSIYQSVHAIVTKEQLVGKVVWSLSLH
jgi:signal peptidase I